MEKTLRKITAFLLILAEMVCFLPQLSMNVAADEAEKQEGYTVMLTGGANAVASGSTVQSGLLNGEMESVYYTADTGYYFEDFEDITINGITVTKLGEELIQVYGIPEADVEIVVPDAVKMPVTYTVRFVVENGAWNDESSDEIVVTLEGDDMKLTAEMIPSAGNMPDFAFVEGEWDVVPDEKTVITEDVTYTYTYAPHGPGWYEYDDNWFYFDEEGKLVENRWFRYKNKWYYVDPEGMMVTGWHEEGGRIYYLTDSGAMATGWARVDDEWYYFDPSSGEMRKGGWFEINGKRYLFYDDGTMWSSAFYCEDDKTYYITEEGTFAKGWQKVDDYWYYFDPSTSVMKTDGWNKINGKWFYLGEDGIMFSGTFYDENDYTYFFTKDGYMATGWQKVDDYWYYFDPSTGVMKTDGWNKINGKWFYLDEDGIMFSGTFYDENDYTYFFTKDGYMATGWQKVDDYWYYFDPSTGVMKTDGWNKINGKWFYLDEDGIMFSGTFYDENDYTYYFTKDGSMATGWNKIDGEWYYFSIPDGAMKTGWLKDNGKWYFMKSDGMMKTGFYYEGDTTYYFLSSGVMATRWVGIDGIWYWFGTDGVMACSTTVTINGKAYEFDSEGICLNP